MGKGKVYCTSFCNQGHDLTTGCPVEHECYVLDPKALAAEREDKAWDGPMHSGRTHRGLRGER